MSPAQAAKHLKKRTSYVMHYVSNKQKTGLEDEGAITRIGSGTPAKYAAGKNAPSYQEPVSIHRDPVGIALFDHTRGDTPPLPTDTIITPTFKKCRTHNLQYKASVVKRPKGYEKQPWDKSWVTAGGNRHFRRDIVVDAGLCTVTYTEAKKSLGTVMFRFVNGVELDASDLLHGMRWLGTQVLLVMKDFVLKTDFGLSKPVGIKGVHFAYRMPDLDDVANIKKLEGLDWWYDTSQNDLEWETDDIVQAQILGELPQFLASMRAEMREMKENQKVQAEVLQTIVELLKPKDEKKPDVRPVDDDEKMFG